MPKMYSELKKAMRKKHYEHRDIAEIIGRSTTYVSARFTGRAAWELDDCYKIMQVLEIPSDKIYAIFPPGGMYTVAADDTKQQKWMRDFTKLLAAGQEFIPAEVAR